MSFMSKRRNIKCRKANREVKRLYGRLVVICIEVFFLVLFIGMGILMWQEIDSSDELEPHRLSWIEEFFIDRPKEEKGEEMVDEELLIESGRYAEELADKEYCEKNRIYVKSAASEDEVVLAFAGDVSFAEGYANMESLKQRGGNIKNCFDEELLREMHAADIFLINNEFTYSDRGMPLENKEYTFRAKTESVNYLDELGVDIVSLANNHTYDYGEVSLLDTLKTLETAGVPYVGAGRNIEEAMKPVYFICNGIKIAFVAGTQIEQFDNPNTIGAGKNNAGVLRCWTEEYIYDIVREAKTQSDFVVAYMHWGTEMEETLHWAQTDQAAKLANLQE